MQVERARTPYQKEFATIGALQFVATHIRLYDNGLYTIYQGRQVPLGPLSPQGLGYKQLIVNLAIVHISSFLDDFIKTLGIDWKMFKDRLMPEKYDKLLEFHWRRNCIVHNESKVDKEYMKRIRNSPLKKEDVLASNLQYLRDNVMDILDAAQTLSGEKSDMDLDSFFRALG